jgi:hypothetical protein
LFEDYRVLAAVQLERLTRHKCDGREHPDLAMDEFCPSPGRPAAMSILPASVVPNFPRFFIETFGAWLREKYRKYRGCVDATFESISRDLNLTG